MLQKENMSEIKFQSKWFERCLKDFLNKIGRAHV